MSDVELSAFLLAGVVDVCQSDGISTEDVLAASGITLATFQSPDATVLRSQAVAVFGALAAASHRRDAAFRAGLCVPIEQSPELVQLFRSAPNLPALVPPLNAALGSVCGGLIGVSVGAGHARLGFGFPTWNMVLEEPFQEAAAGVVVCALRTRYGPRWKPVRVLVGHRRTNPEVVTFAGIEVVRGAPDNAVILTAEEAYSETRQPDLAGPPQFKPEPGPANLRESLFSDDVRLVVFGRLSLTLGTDLEEVSKVFGISGRTLKRRLAAEGSSLSSIVDDVKLGEAKRLLSETGLPVTEIADALRYAHLPSFTRAFKRATGQSPSGYRCTSRTIGG